MGEKDKGHMGMMEGKMPKECMRMMEGHAMSMNGMPGHGAAQGKAHQGIGTVKDVDPAAGKVTQHHEPARAEIPR